MRLPERSRRRRSGVTAVETAMVLLPLMLTFFSIFEYGRFVMLRHLMDLAAETGCRYAVAHNTSATIQTDVGTVVTQYMGGMNNTTQFTTPVNTTVYSVPSSSWEPSVSVVSSSSWTVQPPTHAALVASCSSTLANVNGIQPGGAIAVQVSGTFKTMFPTLIFVPATIPMSSMVILTCEGT